MNGEIKVLQPWVEVEEEQEIRGFGIYLQFKNQVYFIRNGKKKTNTLFEAKSLHSIIIHLRCQKEGENILKLSYDLKLTIREMRLI